MGYTFYRAITIANNAGWISDIPHFPVLVSITNQTYLKYVIHSGGLVNNANGYDIGFFADANLTQKLPWEVEQYDSLNGSILAWVQVPVLYAFTTTTFYMAYYNVNISTDQSNPTGVWTYEFSVGNQPAASTVMHLGNGVTLSAADSTAYGANGTVSGATAGTGEIDGAAACTSGQFVYLPNSSPAYNFSPSIGYSIGLWVKTTTNNSALFFMSNGTSNVRLFLGVGQPTPGGSLSANQFSAVFDANSVSAGAGNSSSVVSAGSGITINDGNWHRVWLHIVPLSAPSGWFTCYLQTYVDGLVGANGYYWMDGGSASLSYTNGSGLNGTALLGDTAYGASHFVGSVDELQIWPAVLGSHWIIADYANQSNPASFISVGTQQGPIGQDSAQLSEAIVTTVGFFQPEVIAVSDIGVLTLQETSTDAASLAEASGVTAHVPTADAKGHRWPEPVVGRGQQIDIQFGS